jgi:hypothetical protein
MNIFVGDVIQNISNSNVISKSKVENAFNKLKSDHDEETANALAKIAEFIHNSGNPAAGVLFDSFSDELKNQTPDKSRLKSFWSLIEQALPTINTIAGAVAKIVPLFS